MGTTNTNKDILTDLLCSPHESTCEGLEELYELIEDQREACKNPIRTRFFPQRARLNQQTPSLRRKRIASYLTEKLFNELTTAKATLREALPEVGKLKMTKSSIVKYAIERILEEYHAMGLESPLVQQIVSKGK